MTRRLAWLTSGVALVLVGCRPDHTADAERPKPVIRSAEADGMKLTVRVSRDKAAVGDLVAVELALEGAGGREVMWPALEDEPDGFHVRALPQSEAPGVPDGGEAVMRRSYQLRPLEAGALTIPGIEVRVARTPATTQPAEQTVLAVEPITLEVTGVAPPAANPTSRPAVTDEPLALARQRRLAWAAWLAGFLGAIVLAVLLVRWWWRRRRRMRPLAPVIAPGDWALEQLRRLRSRRLIEQGRVQEFYFELNMIVRRYIERRFGLRAPEMTTEEFLVSLRDGPAAGRLDRRAQAALLPFLEACDLVKYARYQPAPREVQEVDRTAERFVVETSHDDGAASHPRTELEEMLEEATP